MSAWDKAKELADKHASQGGVFARLQNDGDKIVGAFCGEPFAREVFWTGEKYELYCENDPEHKGKKPTLRVMINFYVPAEKAMRVFEGGTVWFNDLMKVRDKYGLDSYLFEMERRGAAKDPKTKYVLLPDEPIGAAMRAEIDGVELNDLEALSNGGSSDSTQASPSQGQSPTNDRAIGQIVERLKGLPKSAVTEFLGHFEVQRVRELQPRDLPAADALLARLEAAQGGGEVDPFA